MSTKEVTLQLYPTMSCISTKEENAETLCGFGILARPAEF